MVKKVVVVNCGPRKGWNTDTLLTYAAKGAEEAGAEIVKFDLYRLEKYSGCLSCFGCKKERFKGHCIVRDGLTPVLDAIREGDGLIVGSPNYLSEFTSAFRAFYERLIFQNLTYRREAPNCNEHMIPTLLVMTSNAPEKNYVGLVENYKNTFDRFVGPTTSFIAGDTCQLRNYSTTDWPWTYFDTEHKMKRHEEVFPKECEKIYSLGKELFQ